MTKKILITKLTEIKGLKITCKACGASWSFPLGKQLPTTMECFACKPGIEQMDRCILEGAFKALQKLKELSEGNNLEVSIETELET